MASQQIYFKLVPFNYVNCWKYLKIIKNIVNSIQCWTMVKVNNAWMEQWKSASAISHGSRTMPYEEHKIYNSFTSHSSSCHRLLSLGSKTCWPTKKIYKALLCTELSLT